MICVNTRSSQGSGQPRPGRNRIELTTNGGVVDLAYERDKPFAFTGTVKKVVFDLKPHLSAQDELDLHAAAHQGHAAHGLSA
jgi:hypothetical protein